MATQTLNPGRMIIVSFLLTILAGAFLLHLPSAAKGQHLGFLDALFMSTSAVCVTGLSVIDIGTKLTFFGQCVILTLIQMGGLGIMTFSVFLMMVFRQKISLASQISVNLEPQHNKFFNFFHILAFVFMMTFTLEAAGALLLFLRLREIHSLPFAIFSSIFHSVSAFCNAGFSLYQDSLIRFQKETYVPVVFMVLIVSGGLGFMLIDELRVWFQSRMQKKRIRLSLHTRICLTATLVLIFGGAFVIWLLEGHNLLSGLSAREQTVNALFLSVTSRTAGFNTLETPSLTNATLFFVLWLMFIGACPGSTGGGIKVPTFVTLSALIKNQIQGRSTAVFQRRIPVRTVVRSLSVFAAGFLIINAGTFIFQLSEHLGLSHLKAQGSFLDLLFEVTSAFGTVGLSTGITGALTGVGEFLIVIIMFLGRIGPLTLGAAFLVGKTGAGYEYVEEDIAIG